LLVLALVVLRACAVEPARRAPDGLRAALVRVLVLRGEVALAVGIGSALLFFLAAARRGRVGFFKARC
jgi:hypothetical protein